MLPHTISSPIKHLEMGLIAADVPLSMKPNTTLQTLEPATKERGALPNDGITRASLLAGSNPQMRRAFSTTLPQSQPAKPLSDFWPFELLIPSRYSVGVLACFGAPTCAARAPFLRTFLKCLLRSASVAAGDNGFAG